MISHQDTLPHNFLKKLHQTYLLDGAEHAFRLVLESGFERNPDVVVKLHEIAWQIRDSDPELMDEPLLDTIFCQCTQCRHCWLLPPKVPPLRNIHVLGAHCSNCDRVLCSKCTTFTSEGKCPCRASLHPIRKPNGRSRKEIIVDGYGADDNSSPEVIQRSSQNPNLCDDFGHDGSVHIAVDAGLPIRKTASVKEHLDWAQILFESGLPYQARQQLSCLESDAVTDPRYDWLLARLAINRARNNRMRAKTDYRLVPTWPDSLGDAIQHLNVAIENGPNFGPAYLTFAKLHIDIETGTDYSEVLAYAQTAQKLLGETPDVLLTLARTLRLNGRAQEAFDILVNLQRHKNIAGQVEAELKLAGLERKAQGNETDSLAKIQLARRYFKARDHEKARPLFERIVNSSTKQAERYYAEAMLAFTDTSKEYADRISKTHNICQRALKQGLDFGLIHELVGIVYQNVINNEINVDFETVDYMNHYLNAIELDDTCDFALYCVAGECIEKGEISDAKKLLERAAEVETTVSSVYYILTEIYKAACEFDKAKSTYERAKELSPNTELDPTYVEKIHRLCSYKP